MLGALVALAAVLELAAALGISYVAGFSQVIAALGKFGWPWLLVVTAALAVSFVGYYNAYHGIYLVDGGSCLGRKQMRAVVYAGFGGMLAHGGAALDHYAVEATGAQSRDASARVGALAGLEHGVLAIGCSAASIAALATGMSLPPGDFTWPWAVLPAPGFVLAFWLAERYRAGLRHASGWRQSVGVFADSVHLARRLFARPLANGAAPLSMALFWAADMVAAWAALAAFGLTMNVVAFVVGYGTGLLFTRRIAPLAGAGILMLILPMTLWHCGAPLSVAVAGVFVYRAMSLWLPLPFSLRGVPVLREIGEPGMPNAPRAVARGGEPALREPPT